jgi:hypothetical protein
MSMEIGLRLSQLEDGIYVGNGQLNGCCKSCNQSEPAEDPFLHAKTGQKYDLGFQQPEYRPVRSAETEWNRSKQKHRSDAFLYATRATGDPSVDRAGNHIARCNLAVRTASDPPWISVRDC